MITRIKEIYISGRTRKRLFWILQLKKETERDVTIDSIAERLLSEKIEELYPNIKTLEKRLDALEGQLIVELLNPPVEK